jgi:hypothetical protein
MLGKCLKDVDLLRSCRQFNLSFAKLKIEADIKNQRKIKRRFTKF